MGVGQSEIEVAKMADTSIVIAAPGAGDGIQAAKAGILEIADIFTVNKADRHGADATARELRGMLAMSGESHDWISPVIPTIATEGTGFPELTASIALHHNFLTENGLLEAKRVSRIRESLMARTLNDLAHRARSVEAEQTLAKRCAAGTLSEASAVEIIHDAMNTRS